MYDARRKMPTRRRTEGASSSCPRAPRPTTIKGWISDPEKQAKFAHFLQERRIMEVKYVRILNHVHIDWSALIIDTMLKAKKYSTYHLPYALLIS
ncbi:hypothetical protein LR48_Vigan03g121500 [Vigna angularis]|uniref:Uncharacterized protein n=1 Tax=Phaseolus angularis TaxID=3914 RepID=A0A0L9U4T3_PHAAN|nr:hypothetical protein LR48_Vigan03g121500 [Vigna angularis]